jgi:hypothetical protein
VKVLLLSDETGVQDGAPVWVPVANKIIGNTVTYEVDPDGAASSAPGSQTIAFKGDSMKPLSPVYVRVDRSVSGQKTFLWDPRSRLDMGANPSIQRASDPDNYTLVYGDGVGSVTVAVTGARQYTVLDTVLAAEFGSVPATFQGSVLQINGSVGKGWVRNYSGV